MPSMNLTPMRYDQVTPVVVPVTLKDGEYLLIEASADAAIRYRNASAGAARYEDGKLHSLEGVADVEAILVGHCLHRKASNGGPVTDRAGNAKPVGEEFARALLAHILKALFRRAKEISPALEESPDTLEELDDRIARLQERRDELAKGVPAPKDMHDPGEGTST